MVKRPLMVPSCTIKMRFGFASSIRAWLEQCWGSQVHPNLRADFGNTRVRFYLPGQALDVGNGSVAYDLLRSAYFYCGAYDVDIERNQDPPVTVVGSVGQALNGINYVAVHFTYGGLRGIVYPPNPTAYPPENNYSSLLVREYLAGPHPPTGPR